MKLFYFKICLKYKQIKAYPYTHTTIYIPYTHATIYIYVVNIMINLFYCVTLWIITHNF